MTKGQIKLMIIEAERFTDVLHNALRESENPSSGWDIIKQEYGVLEYTDINNTHLCGAVKRKYIDMKYEINKLMK